ncbi:glycerate kinase [Morganella morganii]|uniref:glycerate kinase n=1 Tax=Morganella morganii TaxID=582 RepID=UPI000D8AAA21|nr:glycerate kinase [Morganella morganii]EKK5570067.1 glycerate kinase [Morganella morganii]MDM8750951.1 glycerate kinase [Morganella morganii]SPX94439.1 Glycerate kinase [Morganella morganii]HCT4928840.1 glycerate kinase [Morganella morganii]
MKIVIAPDSFKESLTALQVADAAEAGFRTVFPDAQYIKLPMADGGEGTVVSIIEATQGKLKETDVTAPLGNKVTGFYGLSGDGKTAIIEMAAASGLHLVPPAQRDPRVTTTFGTGELILAALDDGAEKIILGIGGSATNDGGAGMMQALGVVFRDKQGNSLPFGGSALAKLASVDLAGLDPRLAKTEFVVACDVNNPLCGPKGASATFGPQKGATPAMVSELDEALRHYGEVIESLTGKSLSGIAGAGAAGGMGVPLMAWLDARMQPGIDMVIETLDLHNVVKDADLVITGEGRMDSQTIQGKTPAGVAKAAKARGIPVIALVGGMSDDYAVVHEHGIDAVFSVIPRICTLDEALAQAAVNIEVTARNIAAVLAMKIA